MHNIFSKKSRAYLDWASAAPVHSAAQKEFVRVLAIFGNPSSPHEEGRQAKEMLDSARTRIARMAGVKSRAVIFTSGATEANNLAIRGRVNRCRAEGAAYEDMHILYLPTMHSSALGTLSEMEKLGVQTEPIALSEAAIDLKRFAQQLRLETILVCADAVCGETGVRFDTLRLRRSIDAARTETTRRSQALLHVDASQLPLVESIERERLGADMLVLDAQKVGGVRGIGALIIPNGRDIVPITQGGSQEGGLRPGTEPVALAAAFAVALQVRAEGCEEFSARAREARAELISQLASAIPNVQINEGKRQAPHILNISLPGLDTDYAVALLDAVGFAVSTKSACETDSEDGSKTLYVFTGDKKRAASTLRISWGPETRPEELQRFTAALTETARFLRTD